MLQRFAVSHKLLVTCMTITRVLHKLRVQCVGPCIACTQEKGWLWHSILHCSENVWWLQLTELFFSSFKGTLGRGHVLRCYGSGSVLQNIKYVLLCIPLLSVCMIVLWNFSTHLLAWAYMTIHIIVCICLSLALGVCNSFVRADEILAYF